MVVQPNKSKSPRLNKYGLTAQEERFVQLLIVGYTQLKAYRIAFPQTVKWKDITVSPYACKLAKAGKILARMSMLREEQEKKYTITRERVMEEYAKLAFVDLKDAYDENGVLKPLSEIDPGIRGAIAGIESVDVYDGYGKDREKIGELKKLKLHDKRGALSDIAKIQGYMKDQLSASPVTPNVIINISSEMVDSRIQEIMDKALKRSKDKNPEKK